MTYSCTKVVTMLWITRAYDLQQPKIHDEVRDHKDTRPTAAQSLNSCQVLDFAD